MAPMAHQAGAMESRPHHDAGEMGAMQHHGAEMGHMEHQMGAMGSMSHQMGAMGSMEHQAAKLPFTRALGIILATFACLIAVVWITSWFAELRFS